MFGRTSHVSTLELRKQLLIAESELNRTQLFDDLRKLKAEMSGHAHQAKTIAVWSWSAAMLMASLAGFRRCKVMAAGQKPSWFQRTLEWGQWASLFWRVFRRREAVAPEGHL